MKKIIITLILLISQLTHSQSKNFIDKPYLETIAKVDTLIKPDLIYLKISLNEKDKRNKISIEEMERKMFDKLNLLNIDIKKQLKVLDLGSGFVKYFLRKKQVLKKMTYELELYDAKTSEKVISELEKVGISNVNLTRTEYSKMDSLKIILKQLAIKKAIQQGKSMLKPLNQKLKKAIYISDFNKSSVNSRTYGIAVSGYSKFKSKVYTPTIEIRPIEVYSEVLVKFEIE